MSRRGQLVEMQELTAVQRKKSANTVNRNGVVSHDEMRRMEKNAMPTGIETRNNTSMTRRGLGSWFEWPIPRDTTPGRGVMSDADACNAVDRRETKIEPAPPGRPKGNVSAMYNCGCKGARTTKNDSEKCIAFVAGYEGVEDSARRAGDDDRTEKRRPASAEQWPHVFVSPNDNNGREAAKGDNCHDDVGSRGADAEGEYCGHCA